LIGLVVILLGAGYYFYNRHQVAAREDALAQAFRIDDAIIGPADTVTNKAFPTQAAKDDARLKAWSDLAIKYHGTTEGAIAGIYLASDQADKGNYAQAEKGYKDVVDSAPKIYAAQAELSLAQVYTAEGKTEDVEKLLHYRIDHPSELVSSEEAKLELAELLSTVKPAEALKLAEPLRQSTHPAVSKEAINVVGKINMSGQKQ
jgi:predicted negative regulator of RcsB-dependent stress response